jgi:hypothetical protein
MDRIEREARIIAECGLVGLCGECMDLAVTRYTDGTPMCAPCADYASMRYDLDHDLAADMEAAP